ncbi:MULTISPECIES: hypothetical protein [Flavobacterium]|uniref:hypothetical protein n=2 Tax=Flavobacteriaceae TaxID=49546 RepID=UPI0009332279|nr:MULTISPECIES: hypothetical protein [Flavobacterium]RTY67124.1 hypothetical protein EKL95_10110 [Flavobacterium sp. LB2P53]RTY87563.1 hypothetical protein EKL32_26070 [Flavobacterium sp. GSN2]
MARNKNTFFIFVNVLNVTDYFFHQFFSPGVMGTVAILLITKPFEFRAKLNVYSVTHNTTAVQFGNLIGVIPELTTVNSGTIST